ncbi:hypothetical protein [Methanococcus sp. CF]
MNLKEAKKMFEVNHTEEAQSMKIGKSHPDYYHAACVWRGF